jgi:uncharacterized protein YcaQ
LPATSLALSPPTARAIWLHAQRLDEKEPFGPGPDATRRAVEHLGYVQIDTINVIERSHHHILQTRIPQYTRGDLESAQSTQKSIFEYWTHALSYIPVSDYQYFVPAMNRFRESPPRWFSAVDMKDYAALLRRIRKEGALSIRDIDDEILIDKTHPWGSRKPSKGALRLGFFTGDLAISKRTGMLKTYDLARRHFEWQKKPRAASETQFAKYLLDRAIRSQGIVSLDSICYGNLATKPLVAPLIDSAVRRKRLIPVHLDGHERVRHWAAPEALDAVAQPEPAQLVHLLSPFDPLVIQRKRLQLFFGYEHRFEAYVPPDKRVLGYFALPVLVGDEIVAAIDLKTDRQARKLLIQKWTWIARKRAGLKTAVEETLQRFERFQLA